MNFVKLIFNGRSYCYNDSNDLGLSILGCFFSSDVGCSGSSFKDFALHDWEVYTGGNITSLEKENGYIYLSDLYSEEKNPTRLKMSIDQYIQLLDDWQEKVCKHKPKEVIIKYENDQFIIESKN